MTNGKKNIVTLKRRVRYITVALLVTLMCGLCGCGKNTTDTAELGNVDIDMGSSDVTEQQISYGTDTGTGIEEETEAPDADESPPDQDDKAYGEGDGSHIDYDGSAPTEVSQETRDEIDRIIAGESSYENNIDRTPGNMAR